MPAALFVAHTPPFHRTSKRGKWPLRAITPPFNFRLVLSPAGIYWLLSHLGLYSKIRRRTLIYCIRNAVLENSSFLRRRGSEIYTCFEIAKKITRLRQRRKGSKILEVRNISISSVSAVLCFTDGYGSMKFAFSYPTPSFLT
jgi:hypothetical protein